MIQKIPHKNYRTAALFLLALTFCAGDPATAQPAWTLPDQGLILPAAQKQDYIRERMEEFFKPQDPAAPEAAFTAPDGWEYTRIDLDGVPLECLKNPAGTAARAVLQLHGGAYIGGMSDLYRDYAVKQAVLSGAGSAYMLDYRLAPEHKYPAALDDALRAYQYLLNQGFAPGNVVIFGDSAGGNLALELALSLKARNLPAPALLVLSSPWASFETDLPSRTAHAASDLVLGQRNPVMYPEVLQPSYGGDLPLNSPELSPIHADLSALPPLLVQAGGYEMLLDDARLLQQKAAADGVRVTLSVYPEMSHVFALVLPELDESVQSFREIRDFVAAHLTRP